MILLVLLGVIVALAIQATFLYFAAKITGNPTPYKTLFLIALIGALCNLVPFIGWLIGIIVVIALLIKWANMSVLAAILTPIISNILALIVVFFLAMLLGVSMMGMGADNAGLILPLL